MAAPRALPAPKITEKDLTSQVIELARLLGWRVAHFRPGMNQRGRWTTPVQGDGAGFPDLILVRGARVLVAELKVGRNKTTGVQEAWLTAFAAADVPAYVWYPGDWEQIVTTLKETR